MTSNLPANRVVPPATWIIAAFVFTAGFLFFGLLLRDRAPAPVRVLVPMVVPVLLAGYAVLVGYVYGDARRRGMRYVLWTWLAILIPNGIGIVLYFILREPLLAYCTTCGGATLPGFVYCPRCGASIAPSCKQCHRAMQVGWSHCAYCGTQL
jgi:hypothetical protein